MIHARYLPAIDLAHLAPVLDAWRAEHPARAVFALLAEADKARLPVLQAACRDRGLTLLGGIFPALVRDNRFVGQGAWLFGLAEAPVHALIGDLGADAAAAAGRIAGAVAPGLAEGSAGGAPTLFLMFDALVPNIASILDALYLETGDRVNYLGVNAGSETFQPMPCLFDAERVIDAGVLCLLLPPELASALGHGYLAPDEPITATATTGNRIASINWRPAFDVYREQVRASYGIQLDRDNFYRYAVHFPFGIALANGQTLVRIPVALDEDGSIFCVGEIPDGSLLTLLRAPEADSLDTVRLLAARLKRQPAPSRLLFFYCAGRRMHLGAAAEAEVAALARETGAELVGALSLGEIGGVQDWSYPLFHNAALVCAAWEPA